MSSVNEPSTATIDSTVDAATAAPAPNDSLSRNERRRAERTARKQAQRASKQPVRLSRHERHQKAEHIKLTLAELDILGKLSPSILDQMDRTYVESGVDLECDQSVEELGRIIEVRLYNNRHVKSHVNLQGTKAVIRGSDGFKLYQDFEKRLIEFNMKRR